MNFSIFFNKLTRRLYEFERERLAGILEGNEQRIDEECARIAPLESFIRDCFLSQLTPYTAVEGLDYNLFAHIQREGIFNHIRVKYPRSVEATSHLPPFNQSVYLLFALSLFDLVLFKFVVRYRLCGARADLLSDSGAPELAMGARGRLLHSYPLHVHFVRRKWYANGPSRYAQMSFFKYYKQLAEACVNDYTLMETCLRNVEHVFALDSLPINTPFVIYFVSIIYHVQFTISLPL